MASPATRTCGRPWTRPGRSTSSMSSAEPTCAPAHAREAVEVGAGCLWLQLGIASREAGRIALEGGLKVVMDRCTIIEVRRAQRARARADGRDELADPFRADPEVAAADRPPDRDDRAGVHGATDRDARARATSCPDAVVDDAGRDFGLAGPRDVALLALPAATRLAHPPISGFFVGAVGIEAGSGDLVLGGNLEFPGLDLAIHDPRRGLRRDAHVRARYRPGGPGDR